MKFTEDLLARLNSASKYPPILTYHALGQKGRLVDALNMKFTGVTYLYEKINGTNARIVVAPDGDWVIGSREHLLTAKGDRIYTPTEKIVQTVRNVAENHVLPAGHVSRSDQNVRSNNFRVYYGEVYGQGVGAAGKQYASAPVTGFRLFDIAEFPVEILELPNEQISTWRENGGQNFFSVSDLEETAEYLEITQVPYLDMVPAETIPTDLEGMQKFLQAYLSETQAKLDNMGQGQSEGIVLRNADRSTIAKARFEDYVRTLDKK